uniref:BAT2_N domain-containing protein n=1 Tax=Macrostomum lignano TaxID=282301 RepID=A0A1I8I087_9PLAT
MSSTNNQQQKDASSSNSTQPSLSSAASGSNNCAKTEDKTSQGKKPRGPRAGSKRHQHEAGQRQQQRQLIRYNRDTLLQMRDSRLSSAWPRALNRAYVGDGGLWDPVKLFEGERKSAFDGKTKIERVRNVRGAAMVQPSYSSGPSAEDSQSFGRSSRRRKRTKEEAASPAASSTQRQRGWPPGNAAETQQAAKSAEPAADGRKEPRDDVARGFGPSRLGGGGSAGGFVRRSDRPATAGGVGGGGFGSGRGGPGVSGRWERSQGLRDPQGLRGGFQPPRHRPAEEEELPAWFDEGPLDKMEKLELTGLPEDMEAAEGDGGSKKTEATQQQQQQKQQPLDGLGLGSSSFESGGGSSSRFAKWLAVDEPSQPQPQPPAAEAGQRDGAQQQLERIFQDMRGRHGHETNQQPQTAPNVGPSLMHLLRPPQPPPPPPPQRPLHAQEVEANLKSMLFGSEAAAPPPPPPAAVAAASSEGSAMPVLPPNGQARTLEEIESSLGAASSGSDRSSRGSKDSRAIYKLIGDLQPPTAQPMFSSGASSQAAAAAAAAAAQRRLPMPMQAQQLQQLQAMLLSNLQMQAQMMHSSQISGGPGNKAHTLNKLLPQTFRWYRAMNNALQGTRLLNQHFNQAGAAADFAGLETAAGADAAFRRPATSAAAAAASANLSTGSASQQTIAQPAMPIVPPMLLPPKTSSAATSATAAAAGLQGWGGAHNSQLSAMLWNATRLAASVKSANTSTGWSSLHRSPPVDSGVGQPHRPPTKQPVDEMPSA